MLVSGIEITKSEIINQEINQVIEIKNIIKSYGELKVLKGIDLTIKEKEIVTIVGASGAGKSTLLHILGTLDTPDEGELLYDSVNIARLSSNKLSQDKGYKMPHELSGGEQQRVSVARALVNHPRVVLADEPSGNLDTRTKNELHQLFFTLRKELGQTFVIVTHDTELARMSDRQIKLNDGMLMNE